VVGILNEESIAHIQATPEVMKENREVEFQPGQPVNGPGFEPGTSVLRSGSGNYYVTMSVEFGI